MITYKGRVIKGDESLYFGTYPITGGIWYNRFGLAHYRPTTAGRCQLSACETQGAAEETPVKQEPNWNMPLRETDDAGIDDLVRLCFACCSC